MNRRHRQRDSPSIRRTWKSRDWPLSPQDPWNEQQNMMLPTNPQQRNRSMSETNTKTHPDHVIPVAGGITVAIWKRTETQDDGQEISRFSFTIQKRYKKENEWLDSQTYFPSDLPKLRLAIDKAFEYVTLKESQNKGSSTAA